MATSFTIGDNINLTCTVSADIVDEHAMAVVEWRRNKVIIDGTQTTIPPTMESSLYNINGTTVHTITGLDSSEEGEYICSSYITSSDQYILDSDTVNVSKYIVIEGKIIMYILHIILYRHTMYLLYSDTHWRYNHYIQPQ